MVRRLENLGENVINSIHFSKWRLRGKKVLFYMNMWARLANTKQNRYWKDSKWFIHQMLGVDHHSWGCWHKQDNRQ